MAGDLVAIVYSDHADPGGGGGRRLPHVVRAEIPVLAELLRQRGHEVLCLPVGQQVLEAARELALRRPRVVINLCEDLLGDSSHEMHFAAVMELLDLPYTGSPPLALGLCRDKAKTKSLLRQFGIPTPDFTVTTEGGLSLGGLSFPLIAKPSLEDGSLGIDDASVACDEAALRRKVSELLTRYSEVLVEEYVDGRELNVALLDTSPPRVLPVSEIDFSGLPAGSPAICGYASKWDEDSAGYRGTVPVCPASLEEREREMLESLSLAAFRILGMRDYGRIDWRLSETRGLQFLEANPNPDVSPESGFVRSLRAAGMDYQDFLSFLIDAAAGRGSSRSVALPGPGSMAKGGSRG